jgi:hypothetical protein
MSNLKWLKKATKDKAQDIMDLADEYWDTILGDVEGAPKDLEDAPNAIGKMAVVSSLGLMMYMPSNAKQIANAFGESSNLETGAVNNMKGKGYVPKVSQGLEAAARSVDEWASQLEQAPDLSSTESTKELKNFMPMFERLLSDRIEEQTKIDEELALAQSEEVSLLASPEEDGNVPFTN